MQQNRESLFLEAKEHRQCHGKCICHRRVFLNSGCVWIDILLTNLVRNFSITSLQYSRTEYCCCKLSWKPSLMARCRHFISSADSLSKWHARCNIYRWSLFSPFYRTNFLQFKQSTVNWSIKIAFPSSIQLMLIKNCCILSSWNTAIGRLSKILLQRSDQTPFDLYNSVKSFVNNSIVQVVEQHGGVCVTVMTFWLHPIWVMCVQNCVS